MKRGASAVVGVVLGLVAVAILLAGVFGLRLFQVETDRIVVENSRQYIISQQTLLSGLAADCAELDTKIVEAIENDSDPALLAAYENQKEAIDRRMTTVSNTLDRGDIPAEALGGCR